MAVLAMTVKRCTLTEAEFRALWRDLSVPVKEIAARAGISRGNVLERAKRRRLPPRPRRLKTTAAQRERIARMLREKVSTVEIAAFFGVCRDIVWHVHRDMHGGSAPSWRPRMTLARFLEIEPDLILAERLAAVAKEEARLAKSRDKPARAPRPRRDDSLAAGRPETAREIA